MATSSTSKRMYNENVLSFIPFSKSNLTVHFGEGKLKNYTSDVSIFNDIKMLELENLSDTMIHYEG